MARIKFGTEEENVVTREEFPVSKALEILKDEIIAVIGYGVQGPAQAMNMRDNGFKVIIGQAPEFKSDWEKAIKDGWVPGETLFPVVEAVKKATIVQFLVSDAAQRLLWPSIKPWLNEGDALYFFAWFFNNFQRTNCGNPSKQYRRDHGSPKGIRRQRAYQLSGRNRY